jgi:predicted alpha/beta superfamily hydrolase
VIIVAVSAPRVPAVRTALYSPYTKDFAVPAGKKFEPHIEGKGDAYLRWMTEILKKDIDGTYRTYPDADYTALCGYSTGGLNSVYASMMYQTCFHRFIAMSPALAIWTDKLEETMKTCRGMDKILYLYLDVGTNESGRMTTAPEFLEGSSAIAEFYRNQGLDDSRFKFNIYPGAVHSQAEWRKRFPDALRWVFRDCTVSTK